MRDYGALNLALGVLALVRGDLAHPHPVSRPPRSHGSCTRSRTSPTTRLNGQHYDSSDHVAIVASLFFTPIVAIVVLWSLREGR